jgi:hypothetical protein
MGAASLKYDDFNGLDTGSKDGGCGRDCSLNLGLLVLYIWRSLIDLHFWSICTICYVESIVNIFYNQIGYVLLGALSSHSPAHRYLAANTFFPHATMSSDYHMRLPLITEYATSLAFIH